MWRGSFIVLVLFVSPAWAVQTSHWTHTNEADFKKGAMHNVVATNFGDVKLSRAVKTILEEDARVSAVYALAEAPDGTIYAATGPHGVLLRIKEDKAAPLYEFEDNTNVSALLVDAKGGLTIGVSGETGKVYRWAKPGEGKPTEIFADEEVQYIWALAQTPDENLYVATGPHGKLFEVKGDKSKSVIMTSDESNLLSLLSDGKDLLYVGTDPNGLVYRVNRKSKEMFVLFDAAEAEISCLALDKKGNLYAGTAEANDSTAAKGAAAAGAEKAGRPEGTGGVPLPSTPPELPKPPAKPDPNPGEPAPIPKGKKVSLQRWGDGAVSLRVKGHPEQREEPALSLSKESGFTDRRARSFGVPQDDNLRVDDNLRGGDRLEVNRSNREPLYLDDGPGTNLPAPGDKPKPGPATAPAQPNANAAATVAVEPDANAAPRAQGNAIYRIDPDGFVTEIFRQPVLVMSLLERDGTLLVGTGSEGLIYQINPAADETLVLAKVEPKQVLSMVAARDGRVLLGMANVGGIAAMSSGIASEGTFTSPVMDATQISRFGKVHLHGSLPGGTSLTVATRSGNVQDPAKAGWSKWSDESAAAEFVQVGSPAARFLQYRLTLGSKDGGASPVVDEIDIAYQIPNLAPMVKGVKVASGAAATPAAALAAVLNPAPSGPSAEANRVQTITWEAEDANGDTLQYSLYFRSGIKSPWILLKDKLTENHYEWDTRSVADGRYEIRVVASDALSNPPGEGKTTSRVSEAVVVDNTPPVIGDVKSTVKGSAVTIDARAADRTTTVSAIDYSVDSAVGWQMVLPSNKIFDSPEETVSFTVPGLSAGAHQITLRATDAKGNQAFETVLVTIDPPTAER